ncbi:MAG: hypothetical protein JWR89_1398 [Tardiphaga sp.]|jgi:hypothetical protein|uniref:hypothetical protein n=1 Tax=Tardiphaga sp. TaxID=1926292 RepID=UPI0026226D6A|nr:hypothetical protein [Tardiphaga sp.]MDB5501496.1 hypothetical protein [Tardiphaga sp.]
MNNLASDQIPAISAPRAAQILRSKYVKPGSHDSKRTVQRLLEVLDRDDVVSAEDRLEDGMGLRDDTVAADD